MLIKKTIKEELLILTLAVTQVEQKWYLDVFRNALWSIAKGILWFLDGFFDIINGIWRYKFFDNDYVNKIFSGALIVACSWLILKVIIELIMNYIVKNDGRGSPLTIYRGVILAIVMMFLINPLFQFGYDFSTKATNAVINISGMESSSNAEGTISKALIRAMAYDDEMKEDDKEYLLNNWKSVNINSTEGGVLGVGDCYKYSLNFFMLIVLAVVTIFLLFFVAIQMAKRVMEIALMKIVGPFCCTSLTNNQSKAFETWTKSTMGYFLITIVQFICIGLLLNMFGSAIKDNGTLTGIFLIIGALLFTISTPTLISSLLGQQSGMMSAFGDIQSLMAVGSGVNAGLSIAKAGTMSALGKGVDVIRSGTNKISGGISNMFNGHGGSNLNKEQMDNVKEKMNQHNGYGASRLVKQYTEENMKKKPFTSFNNTNPYKNPFSMKYNPIRNQYMSNSGLEANSNFDRKWY